MASIIASAGLKVIHSGILVEAKPVKTTDPFALALKRLRTNAGLSQSELSRRTMVVPSYVARLEQGSRQPSREMVDRIITALNLDTDERLTLLTAAFLPADVVAASR